MPFGNFNKILIIVLDLFYVGQVAFILPDTTAIDNPNPPLNRNSASGAQLDLSLAPSVLYGVDYRDPVSRVRQPPPLHRNLASDFQLDLSRAPFVLFWVRDIDLVPLAH